MVFSEQDLVSLNITLLDTKRLDSIGLKAATMPHASTTTAKVKKRAVIVG
jgi:hypothetical protein